MKTGNAIKWDHVKQCLDLSFSAARLDPEKWPISFEEPSEDGEFLGQLVVGKNGDLVIYPTLQTYPETKLVVWNADIGIVTSSHSRWEPDDCDIVELAKGALNYADAILAGIVAIVRDNIVAATECFFGDQLAAEAEANFDKDFTEPQTESE